MICVLFNTASAPFCTSVVHLLALSLFNPFKLIFRVKRMAGTTVQVHLATIFHSDFGTHIVGCVRSIEIGTESKDIHYVLK